MRPRCERDMVALMRDQLVEAFLDQDRKRYEAAARWLLDYVQRERAAVGKVQHGEHWYRPGLSPTVGEHGAKRLGRRRRT